MYCINKKTKIKGKINGYEIIDLGGFLITSRKASFSINNQTIKDVKIINKKLAYPIVSRKVFNKYNKLITLLTELLISDDDSGDVFLEVLNRIEKFRLEIKNKYRSYLKQKELELMSKQLTALKKEANSRLEEIRYSYIANKTTGKGK